MEFGLQIKLHIDLYIWAGHVQAVKASKGARSDQIGVGMV